MSRARSFLFFKNLVKNPCRHYNTALNEVFGSKLKKELLSAPAEKLLNQNILLTKKLRSAKSIQDQDWANIRQELSIRLNNPDILILDICDRLGRCQNFLEYLQYLRKNNHKFTLNILGKYLSFLAKYTESVPDYESEILKTYEEIRKKYELLDSETCGKCITALCQTSKWKDSLDLLEMAKITSKPNSLMYIEIVKAAFKNGDLKLGWEFLHGATQISQNSIIGDAYISYLNYCVKHFKGEELEKQLEKMCYFWKKKMSEVPKTAINEYVRIFETLGYETHYTVISKK